MGISAVALVEPARAEFKQSPTPPDAKGYTYKTADGIDLRLDVFTPPNSGPSRPLPVLIAFHGGGWDHGDKSSLHSLCRYFANRGLVTVSVSYRFINPLINQGKAEMGAAKSICVEDGKSAIRWVRSHAHELGVDLERVLLAGDSAGTEIALVSGLSAEFNAPNDDVKVPTSCLGFVLLNPAFVHPGVHYKEDPRLEPFDYITSTTPPLIMFSGSKDGWLPRAVDLFKDTQKAGSKSELWIAPEQLHGFTKDSWMNAACAKADQFLCSLGLLSGAPGAAPSDVSFVSWDQFKPASPR